MEFDKSKVYSAKEADELKIGSEIIVADTYGDLKQNVLSGEEPRNLLKILDEYSQYRFQASDGVLYALAYLVSEPAKLKWTDLKVGDIIKKGRNTAIVIEIDSDSDDGYHILAGSEWLSEFELEDWEKVEHDC